MDKATRQTLISVSLPLVETRRLRELAHRQYGLLTRTQLLDAGLGRGYVEARAGVEWPALLPGVYRCCESAEPLRQQAMAAVLRWPNVRISHFSASRLRGWEEPVMRPKWDELGLRAAAYIDSWPDERIHVTSAAGHPRNAKRYVIHRGDPGELVFIGGLPCSDTIATAVQIAASAPLAYSVPLLDRLTAQDTELPLRLRDFLDTRSGMPGVARARLAVSLVNGLSQSILESLARLLMRLGGLPVPRLQVVIVTELGEKRGDLGYDDCDLVIELDGRKGHERWRGVVADLPRQNAITNSARRVLRFGWNDVMFQPLRFLSTIATARSRTKVPNSRPAPSL